MTPTYVDNTLLKAVAACDLQAVLRHVQGLTSHDEAFAMHAGIGAHEALAAYLTDWNIPRALDVYAKYYGPRAAKLDLVAQPWNERLTLTNTSRILERWMETHPPHALPFIPQPGLIEVGFAIPLDDTEEFIFTGRLDAFALDSLDRKPVIVDHKTKSEVSPKTMREYKIDSQLSGYVWAAERTTGERIRSVYVNAIEFSKLPSSDRKCSRPWKGNKPHGVPYSECGVEHASFEVLQFDRSDEQLARWHADALRFARRFKLLREMFAERSSVLHAGQRGAFTGACSRCTFREFCEHGRPLDYLDTKLIHEPWEPFDRNAVPTKGAE